MEAKNESRQFDKYGRFLGTYKTVPIAKGKRCSLTVKVAEVAQGYWISGYEYQTSSEVRNLGLSVYLTRYNTEQEAIDAGLQHAIWELADVVRRYGTGADRAFLRKVEDVRDKNDPEVLTLF